MVDHEIDEFELIRGECAVFQETGEGVLGRLAVQSDQGADEPREATIGARSAIYAGLDEDARSSSARSAAVRGSFRVHHGA
jgi:hypothetical protein